MSLPVLWTEAIIAETYIAVSIVLLVKFYSRPSIKFRCPDLLILQALASAFVICVQMMWLNYRKGDVCILVRAAVSTVSPMLCLITTIRIAQIAAKYCSGINAEKKIHRKERSSAPQINTNSAGETAVGATYDDDLFHTVNIYDEQKPQIALKASETVEAYNGNFYFRNMRALSLYMGSILAKRKRFFNTGNVMVTVTIVGCIGTTFFLITEMLSDPYTDEKYCVTISWFGVAFNSLCILGLFFLHPVIFYGNDTYGIRIELYCMLVILMVGFVCDNILRLAVIHHVPVRFTALLTIWNHLALHWISIGTPLLEAILGEYHSRKSLRNGDKKKAISIKARESYIAADWGTFLAMLKNPESLAELTLFAVREFSVENLLFYRRVELLKRMAACPQLFSDNSGLEQMISREIMSIYSEFIVEGSELELNINDTTRIQIEEAVMNNQLSIQMFNNTYQEILMLVFQNTFPRYLQEKV